MLFDPSFVAAPLIALLLATLPLVFPLRSDVAYLVRKAWPGSLLARATGMTAAQAGGTYRRISVLDVSVAAAVAMAVSAALIGSHSPDAGPATGARALLLAGLAVPVLLLIAFDLRYRVLPDMLTLPVAATGLMAAALVPGAIGLDFWSAAAGCFGAGAALWLVQSGFRMLRGIEGLGGGDVKLAAAMGAWLGPMGCAFAIATAAFGALAAELAIALIRDGRIDPTRRLPLGAYLCGAFWIAVLLGPVA